MARKDDDGAAIRPFPGADVEFTEERWLHVAEDRPGPFPAHECPIREALADPDDIPALPLRQNASRLVPWFEGCKGGKFIVLVAVSDRTPPTRHCRVTAYFAATRNPHTEAVESLEILSVGKSSFQYADPALARLSELLAAPTQAPQTRGRSSR